MRSAVMALVLLLLAPGLGGSVESGRTVRFSLTIDYALLARLATVELRGTDEEAALWRSEDGCSVFEIAAVRVEPAEHGIEIHAQGRGKAGLGVLSWCLFPIKRDAELRITARPEIGPDWQLRLRDVHATVLDAEGRSTFVMRRITGVVGEPIEDAVSRITVDLSPPAADAREVIRTMLEGAQAARATAALESLRPEGAEAAADGVRVEVAMDVPPAPPGPPPLVGPEPPLTPEERQRWADALDDWDAFLTFAVKELGFSDRDRTTVDALFRLFVDGRRAILEALDAPPERGRDPVRRLFLETWTQLRDVVRRVARRSAEDAPSALRYLQFLAAGDALAALEDVGPDVGIEISADGLRRLARALDPETLFDPRMHGDRPDPALRELFGFHEPPATALPPLPPDTTTTTMPRPPPPGAWWWWSPGGVAHAEEAPATRELQQLGSALDRWVPEPSEMERYRTTVSRLLDLVASGALEGESVARGQRQTFRQIVRATAWQETCWHHYARRGGRVVVLVSSTGDVGLMQVNRRVWRGVFDAALLERDVVYNADAGAQILAQYLTRYGQREGGRNGGHVARATYAAYNGGPGAYTRYRTGRRASAYTRRVDAAFWKKYQVVAAGRELEHVPCPPRVR